MRYRSIGTGRAALSAVSLDLAPTAAPPAAARALVFAALESGINTFHVRTDDAERLAALGEAIATLDRGLVLVVLKLTIEGTGPDQAAEVEAAVPRALAASGLRWCDAVVAQAAEGAALDPAALDALRRHKGERRMRFIGVGGRGPAVDDAVRRGGLDLLAARYNLLSGWPERNRIKVAQDVGLWILGHGYAGEGLVGMDEGPEVKRRRLPFGLGRRGPDASPARAEGYEFLRATPGWTPEEICLAYALTEPALSTVEITADSPQTIERLARAPEREMPAGLAAQIEMGRFSARGRAAAG